MLQEVIMNTKELFLYGTIFVLLTLIIFIFILNWYLNKNVKYTNKSDKKKLIVYYSQNNHTEKVANMLKKHLNCDIEKIKSEEYENINAIKLNNLVTEQMQKDYIPKTNKIDVSNYDVIFIGSPVWKDDISLPVKSFLINNNFNDKIIIPFYTFGGFVNKSKLDNQIKIFSRSDNVQTSFLTICHTLAFMEYRLVNWLNKL